ncbi:hypothetical protein [Burkholderia seminalis]|uniref:Uncharacterized protein n=1 Tax=Burkholderia seminalis TaxID=488731 RepID=A0A8A8D7B9_9BURK|nr:hypothetical protein [Burkholderia seminalis]QTO20725.1 hypothetical protein DT99_025635 [Burkholderia seminalis]
MSSHYNNSIERNRHNPGDEVFELRSLLCNIHLDEAAAEKAKSLLRTVYASHQPAMREHAYRAWRGDPQTKAFAEAFRARFLPDYRDDGVDPTQVEPTAELTELVNELPEWVLAPHALGNTERYTRRFAGQPALLQREAGDRWRLTYLGYRSVLFVTREIAERDAPSFALAVLDTLTKQLKD